MLSPLITAYSATNICWSVKRFKYKGSIVLAETIACIHCCLKKRPKLFLLSISFISDSIMENITSYLVQAINTAALHNSSYWNVHNLTHKEFSVYVYACVCTRLCISWVNLQACSVIGGYILVRDTGKYFIVSFYHLLTKDSLLQGMPLLHAGCCPQFPFPQLLAKSGKAHERVILQRRAVQLAWSVSVNPVKET